MNAVIVLSLILSTHYNGVCAARVSRDSASKNFPVNATGTTGNRNERLAFDIGRCERLKRRCARKCNRRKNEEICTQRCVDRNAACSAPQACPPPMLSIVKLQPPRLPAALSEFRRDQIIWPTDDAYNLERLPWSQTGGSAFEELAYPRVVIFPENVADILSIYEYANSELLHILIRNGGHIVEALSTASNSGIVMDMRRFDGLELETVGNQSFARLGAGLITLEATELLWDLSGGRDPDSDGIGQFVPFGNKALGISGITLNGGLSDQGPKYGMTCDLVVALTAVVWDGALQQYTEVVADENTNPDLFFAFRGGTGGNYGVVTSWTFKTFPIKNVYEFKIAIALGESVAALQEAFEWLDGPDVNDNVYLEPEWDSGKAAAADCMMAEQADECRQEQIDGIETEIKVKCLCEVVVSGSGCDYCRGVSEILFARIQKVVPDAEGEESTTPWDQSIWSSCKDLYDPNGGPGPELKRRVHECLERPKFTEKARVFWQNIFLTSTPSPEIITLTTNAIRTQAEKIVSPNTFLYIEWQPMIGQRLIPPPYGSAFGHRDTKWWLLMRVVWNETTTPEVKSAMKQNVKQLWADIAQLERQTERDPVDTLQIMPNFPHAGLAYQPGWTTAYFNEDGTYERLQRAQATYNPFKLFSAWSQSIRS